MATSSACLFKFAIYGDGCEINWENINCCYWLGTVIPEHRIASLWSINWVQLTGKNWLRQWWWSIDGRRRGMRENWPILVRLLIKWEYSIDQQRSCIELIIISMQLWMTTCWWCCLYSDGWRASVCRADKQPPSLELNALWWSPMERSRGVESRERNL